VSKKKKHKHKKAKKKAELERAEKERAARRKAKHDKAHKKAAAETTKSRHASAKTKTAKAKTAKAGARAGRARAGAGPKRGGARRTSARPGGKESVRRVKSSAGASAVPDLYSLFESIHYREFKILLKAQDFSGDIGADVADYWKLARDVAKQLLIEIQPGPRAAVAQRRSIVFLDTPNGDLYQRSFMLRTRSPFVGDRPGPAYELTLKFRSPDIAAAADVDVNAVPRFGGVPKFKEELLLTHAALGGMRSIFSHTCQLKEQTAPLGSTLGDLAQIFPELGKLGLNPKTKLGPASPVPVEEVLYDLGLFGFRGGRSAKVNMAVWRRSDTEEVMIGEFAYETHFRHYGKLHPHPKLRSERYYRLLQRETGAWVELGSTKTALYYGLSGKKIGHDE
jgi:hypothetical protein